MKKLLVLIAGALGATLLKKKLDDQQAERDLWAALPALRARLAVIDPARPQRSVAAVLTHLRSGGALLTFPAGRMHQTRPGARRSRGRDVT